MKVSEELQEFLRDEAVQLYTDNNDFDSVYREAQKHCVTTLRDLKYIGELTILFYKAGIDPLKHMNEIPPLFISGADIYSFEIPQHIASIDADAFRNSKLDFCCNAWEEGGKKFSLLT